MAVEAAFEKPLLPEEAGVAKAAAGGESMKKALVPRLREYRRRPRRRRHVSFKVTLALSSSKQRRRHRHRTVGPGNSKSSQTSVWKAEIMQQIKHFTWVQCIFFYFPHDPAFHSGIC